MESEEDKGELNMFRQSEESGHDLDIHGLKCHSYDDVSSDTCSDAGKQLDVVSGEPDNTVEGNVSTKNDIDAVKVRDVISEDNDCGCCDEYKQDVSSQESKAEDSTTKLVDYANHQQAEHTAAKETDKKTSVENALGHIVHESNFVPDKVKQQETKSRKDNTHLACEYRTGFRHSLYGRTSPMDRCSPPNFSSDSDTDFSNFKSHNQKIIKSLLSSENDLMKFAEILYKCTLCTSIPSILTSKSNFLKHVKEQHFTNDSCMRRCEFCSLKFCTEEDLKEHVKHLHKKTSQITDVMSHDQTGSDVIIKSHDNVENENDSDSDSSGHRNYKAKLVKKSKPVLDFENPKQLVDHTGIQTLDGSLDLSKKDSSFKIEHKEHTVSVKAEKSPKHAQEPNMVHVQQITDQIMKSNFQGRNPSTPNGPLPFTPSYTQEFGKYTKLVREGGNIVYFCQVCNWKSPIKATFHGHCGTATHKSKVLQTEDPDSADSSVNCDRNPSSQSSPNISVSAACEQKSRDSNYWAGQNRTYMSKVSEGGLYGQFVQPRGISYNGRSTVISPFKNGNSNERHNPYKRNSENAMDLVHKGSKKLTLPSVNVKKGKSRGCSSDSDSEEGNDINKKNEHLFPWNKHPLEMPSLYQNYPFLPFCPPSGYSYDRFYSSAVGSNKLNREPIIKTEIESADCQKHASQLFSISSNKRQIETSAKEKEIPNKRCKDDNADNTETAKYVGDKVESLFKLYKCHACPFEYSDIEEYEKHFEEVHKTLNQSDVCVRGFLEKQVGKMTDLGAADFETGEHFRVQKLKEIIPDYVVEDKQGNVPRDYLLQCISLRGIPNVELWSSACNKAMREVYPHSLAQRKGKYKKTYYFGVAMVESYQGQEETVQTEGDPQLYNPLRDLNLDMEKIMEQLPAILFWTGSMEAGVYRGELLLVIADNLQNQDITNWGPQCNRAIRLVFPKVDIKRKGKFKSTMYFGVDFHSSVRKAPILSQSKNLPVTSGFLDIGDTIPPSSEGFHQGEEFPMWMKQEAQKNMKWYLQRFGGVTSFDATENDEADDDDNDGDDEGESVESSVNPEYDKQ